MMPMVTFNFDNNYGIENIRADSNGGPEMLYDIYRGVK